MSAWDFPIVIVGMVIVALVVAAALFKVGLPKRGPDFECDVCGRSERGLRPREWRYCPYCGTPRPRRPRIPGVSL